MVTHGHFADIDPTRLPLTFQTNIVQLYLLHHSPYLLVGSMARTIHEPTATPVRRTVLGERNDNVFHPSPVSSKKPKSSRMRIATQSPLMNERPPSSVAGLTDLEDTPVAKVQNVSVDCSPLM
jgi:hypothetical protein